MEIFRKLFKDKKIFYNVLVAIFLCIMLLILTNTIFDGNKNKKQDIEYREQTINTDTENNDSYELQLEKRLKNILSKISGVGAVDVMISIESSKEIVTKNDIIRENSKTDEQALNGDKREIILDKYESNTVKINGDKPLILKELSPKISGVLIVAQGGGNVTTKNNLIKATNALLGIDLHKIEVLEMKK